MREKKAIAPYPQPNKLTCSSILKFACTTKLGVSDADASKLMIYVMKDLKEYTQKERGLFGVGSSGP